MKRKRFSVEQIVAVLNQAEAGMPVAELIRNVGCERASRIDRSPTIYLTLSFLPCERQLTGSLLLPARCRKRHNQALIALARRRCDVLFAMLRDGTIYQPKSAPNT